MKFEDSDITEAALLKNEAMSLGVPEEDIIIEDISLNTFENVISSLLVLNREFQLHNIKRILVVTNTYHMKRLHLTLKKYMPGWIKFTLCTTHDGVTRMDNWFLSKRVEYEFKLRLKKSLNMLKKVSSRRRIQLLLNAMLSCNHLFIGINYFLVLTK
jgi:hypothetical protein